MLGVSSTAYPGLMLRPPGTNEHEGRHGNRRDPRGTYLVRPRAAPRAFSLTAARP